MTPKPQKPAPAQTPARPAPSWLPGAVVLARLAAGGVLFAAGVLKAAGPVEEFAHIIENYGLVSPEASMSLAAFLPWVEMLAGFALASGYLTRAAAACCGALFLSFLTALGSALARGIPLANCGCFGGSFHPAPQTTFLMDLALLAACAAAWRWGESSPGLDSWAQAAPGP